MDKEWRSPPPDPVLEGGYTPISSEDTMQISHYKWQQVSMNYPLLFMEQNYILAFDFKG